MLSVVLYGRNDSHGYNLHKRGALSLNCIAEVLTDDADELIFVDYNTPDELPTFPEALADTLTDHCRSRLRILRVRPSFHAQFTTRTHLAALECQSRNIAIRRSNPSNRWVLSTNTDMIFCPADAGSSLTEVVAGLEDGFYHLPRFEVPEGFWERLARTDPTAAIKAMGELGRRYHMNEVVYGSYDNIYEGPGDFQLFLRQDLFEIHGFDEQMIRGWHADSNIARRMKLLRGEVKTAFPQVLGYHCGHTRQATSLHRGVRTENSMSQFVRDLAEAALPAQVDDWGAPDADIEEVRLTSRDLYFTALSKAVPPEPSSALEAAYNLESYGKTNYDPAHVLPHLCDLVFNLRAGQRIAFIGNDVALLEGLRTFLEDAGKAPSFVLLDQGDAPPPSALDPDRWGGRRASFDTVMAEADLFIIQHPSADMTPVRECRRLELFCWWTLAAFAERELQKPFAQRRRLIVVNGIHNNLSAIVEPSLAPTTMPFSTRLRQGFVVDLDANRRWTTDGRALLRGDAAQISRDAQALDADSRWSADEQAILAKAVRAVVAGEPLAGWERLCAELLDIAQSPQLAEFFGLSAKDSEALAREAQQAAGQIVARCVVPPEPVLPRPGVANRLCSPADWRDPAWAEIGLRYYGVSADAFLSQSRWTWERITLHDNLLKAIPPTKPTEPARVLLITEVPDLLARALVYSGYEVIYATVGELLGEEDSRPLWDKLIDYLPACQSLLDADLETAGPVRAILMTVPTFVERGGIEMDRVLDLLAPLADDQTLFSSAFTVQLDAKAYSGVALSLKEWEILFESNGALGSRGFSRWGEVDPTVPLDTVLRFALDDEVEGEIAGLSFSSPKGVFTIGAFAARWPALRHPGFNLPIMHMSAGDTALYERLGRAYPFFGEDWDLLAAAIQGLATGQPIKGWERLALEMAAIAATPGVHHRVGLDESSASTVLGLCDQAIQRAAGFAAIEPSAFGPLADSLNRLCTGMDWEHGLWGQVLDRLFGSECRTLAEHKRWIWERASLVYGLHKALDLPRSRQVLVITPGPDPLGNLVSNMGFNVTCATAADLMGATDEGVDWQAVFEGAWLRTPGALRSWAERDPSQRFDAVVCTQTVLLDRADEETEAMLAAIASLIGPGGQLHCVATVQIDDGQLGGALTLGEWRGLYADEGPLGARGFTALGGFNGDIPLDTVVRYAYEDDVGATVPGLSFGYSPDVHLTVGVISAAWPDQLRPGPSERLTVVSDVAQAAPAVATEDTAAASSAPQKRRFGLWGKR